MPDDLDRTALERRSNEEVYVSRECRENDVTTIFAEKRLRRRWLLLGVLTVSASLGGLASRRSFRESHDARFVGLWSYDRTPRHQKNRMDFRSNGLMLMTENFQEDPPYVTKWDWRIRNGTIELYEYSAHERGTSRALKRISDRFNQAHSSSVLNIVEVTSTRILLQRIDRANGQPSGLLELIRSE